MTMRARRTTSRLLTRAFCALVVVLATTACLPPTKTGKTCSSHEECEYDALWSPIEPLLAPPFMCDFDRGLCVPGVAPSDAGVDDDAGLVDDGGPAGEDAGVVDAGDDAGAPFDAGFAEDAGNGLPPLAITIGQCASSIDVVEDLPITGLVVARSGGPTVSVKVLELGLIGLFPLCVITPVEVGRFTAHLSNIFFEPFEQAFDGDVVFASIATGAPRRVHVTVVDESDVRMWRTDATSDDVSDPSQWRPTGTPLPSDTVYVPVSQVPPSFTASSLYARSLVVESGAEIRVEGGLGLGKSALIAGRTATDIAGKLLLNGADLGPLEAARLGGAVSALEIRENARASLVAPLDVERALVVTSASSDARPELRILRPVRLAVGGELIVGSNGVFDGFGRVDVDHDDARIEVFGAVAFRTVSDNTSTLSAGTLVAWSAFSCRAGAATFSSSFRVRFPGDEASPVGSDLTSVCALGSVHIEAHRLVRVLPLQSQPSLDIETLSVDGTLLAEVSVESNVCCAGTDAIFAAGPSTVITVGGELLVDAESCVSARAGATFPGDPEVVCGALDTTLCGLQGACGE